MGRCKEKPKYHILSLRVSEDEKACLAEITRKSRKSTSMLMREAIQLYFSKISEPSANQG